MASTNGTVNDEHVLASTIMGEGGSGGSELSGGRVADASDGKNGAAFGAQVEIGSQEGAAEGGGQADEATAVAGAASSALGAGSGLDYAEAAQEESIKKTKWDEDEEEEEEWEEEYEGLELLPWPHPHLDACICLEPEIEDMNFDDFYEMFRYRTEMDEDEMREFHSNLWQHRGVPQNWQEPGNSTPGRAGVQYDKCAPSELKRFVVDRGLRDPFPPGLTLRYLYLPILRKADRETTFPIMDLPPELRVHICRQLFSTGYSHKMDVAILRSCRQIYEEANELPYSEPVVLMSFKIEEDAEHFEGRPYQEFRMAVQGYSRYFGGSTFKYIGLPRAIDDYPDHLRRIQRLELRLTYELCYEPPHKTPVEDGWQPINQFLFGLASFLMEGHQVRHFTIVVDFPKHTTTKEFEQCFYPLLRVRDVGEVTIEGDVPDYIIRKLTNSMTSSGTSFNTLRQWKTLHEEVQAQMALLDYLESAGCNCGECRTPGERAFEIDMDLDNLICGQNQCCFSSVHEENFMARLGRLRRTLRRVDLDSLAEKVRKLASMRKAADATGVDDAGALEQATQGWGNDIFKPDAIAKRPNHDWEAEGIPPLISGPPRAVSATSSQFAIPEDDCCASSP